MTNGGIDAPEIAPPLSAVPAVRENGSTRTEESVLTDYYYS